LPIPLPILRKYWKESLQFLPTHIHSLPRRIDFHLVSIATISSLHDKFLNDPTPTDVITFQHGEVFICPHIAKEQSRQYGTSLIEETAIYGLHGLLHLIGYEDCTPSKRATMHRWQNKIHALIRHHLAVADSPLAF
jgi:probable rRNA maturation factor